MERTSESGFPIDPVYDASKLTDFQPEAKLGRPGEYPFTRGVYPRRYVDRPWTMRQYAGFATASESNHRYHELIEAGTTGLSVAFDLPTQLGYDSDAPAAAIERGFQKAEIESAAYQVAREIDEGDRIVVGVNKFAADGEEPYQPLRVDPAIAEGTGNVLYPLRDALRADATLGEVCDALRVVWGEYRPSEM
jgi:methylmalonyl-CoA mutase N-terminal domain/subunit